MTEAEWRSCPRPSALLVVAAGKMSDRQLRLYSCACCHRTRDLVDAVKLDAALDALERFADGKSAGRARILVGKTELESRAGLRAEVGSCVSAELRHAARKTVRLNAYGLGDSAAAAFGWCDHDQFWPHKSAALEQQAHLLRDIVGNPFRPVIFAPEWRTSTAVALAQGIYDDRAFDRMPILADALQDAGCDADELLAHCRDPQQVHVRGCWVVDAVLGKS